LVDKSLVVSHLGAAAPYRLLVPIADFARRRAESAGELRTYERRHRDWFLGWTEGFEPVRRFNSTRLAETFEAHLPDIRAALRRSIADGDHELATRQFVAVAGVWWILLHSEEGLRWAQQLRQLAPPSMDLAVEFDLTTAAAALAAGDYHLLRSLLPTAAERAARHESFCAPMVYAFLSMMKMGSPAALDDIATARSFRHADQWSRFIDHCEGDHLLVAGQHHESIVSYERSLRDSDGDDFRWWSTAALACTAVAETLAGDHGAAVATGKRAAELAASGSSSMAGAGRAVVVAIPLAAQHDLGGSASVLGQTLEACAPLGQLNSAHAEPLIGAVALAHHSGDDELARAILATIHEIGYALRSPWQFALFEAYQEEVGRAEAAPSLAEAIALTTDLVERLRPAGAS
jgi:hypothetical protein